MKRLEESDFSYNQEGDILEIDHSVDLNITGPAYYSSLIKVILDDHEKAEKYDEEIIFPKVLQFYRRVLDEKMVRN